MSEKEIRAAIDDINASLQAEGQGSFRARAFAALVGGSVIAASIGIGLTACGGSKPAKSPGGSEGAGGADTETVDRERDPGPMPPYMAP